MGDTTSADEETIMVVFFLGVGREGELTDVFLVDRASWATLTSPPKPDAGGDDDEKQVYFGDCLGKNSEVMLEFQAVLSGCQLFTDKARVEGLRAAMGDEYDHFGNVDLLRALEDYHDD